MGSNRLVCISESASLRVRAEWGENKRPKPLGFASQSSHCGSSDCGIFAVAGEHFICEKRA